MNDAANIIENLLSQAGLHARVQGDFIYMEDPACITRGFENFATNAWTVLVLITFGLVLCWGVLMIRGAKNDIKENIKNLVLIFGIMTASGSILNLVYGGDLFGVGCREMKVSIDNVKDLLAIHIQTTNNNVSLNKSMNDSESGTTYVPKESGPGVQNNHGHAVSASVNSEKPNEIVYTGADGTRWVNVDGNLTWRANNPGALRTTNFTRRMGQIGVTQNGFAIFPDMETGRMAVFNLLKTNTYQNRTIAETMQAYAPWEDGNNPTSYANRVARYVGVSVHTYLRDLSDNQLNAMVQAINMVEGSRPGTIRNL